MTAELKEMAGVGGGGGIRTPEGFLPLVFKTSAMNRSANPPVGIF